MSEPPPEPALRTARLLLRPCKPGDRREFVRVMQQGWADHLAPWSPVAQMMGGDPEGMFAQTLRRSQHEWTDGTGCRLLAFDSAGALVGGFNLNAIVRGAFQCGHAGWWVAADQLRRGYATEGVRALLGLAFAPAAPDTRPDGTRCGLGLHRVQCGVIPSNIASLAVAERAGFRREGLALRYLCIAGQWQDHVIFARTVEDGPLPPVPERHTKRP